MKKICVIVTVSMNLNSLYKDQFKYLIEKGFEVTAISSYGIEHEWLQDMNVKTKAIHMERRPAIFKDIVSLINLITFFSKNRFDIVSVSTPKASLIGSIAAFLTFHKNIIYTQRGRAYESMTGISKSIYISIEKLICKISKKTFCISHEIKNEFVEKQICDPNKLFVIGSGSSNGVDLEKYTMTETLKTEGRLVRTQNNIKESDIVILYSGRIRKDKGINELVKAFNQIKNKSNLHLILQGEYEIFDKLDDDILNCIKANSHIHEIGWQKDNNKFLAAADIFVFPSHREGFGNVAIEASAMNLPVVGFNVVGVRESVVNNYTGLLCSKIDVKLLSEAINSLIINKDLRIKLGNQGRSRIEKEFDSLKLWDELVNIYNILIKKK